MHKEAVSKVENLTAKNRKGKPQSIKIQYSNSAYLRAFFANLRGKKTFDTASFIFVEIAFKK